MTKLTFDAAIVKQLIADAKTAKDHRLAFGQTKREPGLWLVGDEGVYLMSNGIPVLKRIRSDETIVAYAHECNPKKMPFNTWWEAKSFTFGGDDGVEFIPLCDLPEDGHFAIEMSPETLAILVPAKK